MKRFAAMRSLAVNVPRTVRTNDYYKQRFPHLVAAEEQKTLSKLFSPRGDVAPDAFIGEMMRYVDDPFRGTVERRVLAEGETALSLELPAAKEALALAGMSAGDIDLILVSSFLPDQLGVGNAVFLAKELGTKRAAWNIESTCASSIVGLHTASALVESGRHDNVLVVVSCTYSRVADDSDTLSWFTGDGAGAFVISKAPEGVGLLGSSTISTTETCNTFYFQHEAASNGKIVMRCMPPTGRVMHETSEPHLRAACKEATESAGVNLSDIDFVITNTPSAFFAAFVTRVLDIDPSRTISTYDRYANIGGALMPVNLHAAAKAKKIAPGDLVLLYGFGGVSSASAAVIRWGDVALGRTPE